MARGSPPGAANQQTQEADDGAGMTNIATEHDWLTCTAPGTMIRHLDNLEWAPKPTGKRKKRSKTTDRKWRLFAVACCRRIWPLLVDARSRNAVEVAEQHADSPSLIGAELDRARDAARAAYQDAPAGQDAAPLAAVYATYATANEAADRVSSTILSVAGPGADCVLLRDLFGNPFGTRPTLDSGWLSSNDSIVKRLAEEVYEDRALPEGTLDNVGLCVLADALEDAGCADAALLGHLRGAGPHVRGCFVVDLLTGRE
jgi:hypothetical protein